jgi:SulP family sulfate permease
MSKIKAFFSDFDLFSNIKGDIFGGLTAGIVALPLALAFGVQSGLGAPAGLFGAIFIGFFAALFGGTRTQISGPTAPMTAVSMLIIAGIIQANDGHLESALPSILLVFFLAGIFQIIFGFVKLGSSIKYIPYPVVSGFMTGIGVIILITQLLPLFGYNPSIDQENINKFKPQAEEVLLDKILKDEAKEGLLVLEDFKETVRRAELTTPQDIELEAETLVASDASGVLGAIKYLPKAIKNISWIEFLVALLTIIIIFGFKRITKKIPSTLVALLVVTLGVILLNINAKNIGEIPSGFPKAYFNIFYGFSFSQIAPYIFTAISLALLGAIDSLLTSVVADNMTKTKHNSNRELIGQGIGNGIAAIFGGIPGAGATIRTVVNIDAGGKSRLSGMVASILLLVILLILGPYASQIPKAVLAGILITVGIGVMDYKGLRALKNMPKHDAIVLIIVLLLTVFWDLIFAVAIGLVLSSLMFMREMGEVARKKSHIKNIIEEPTWKDEEELPAKFKEEVFIKHMIGPLFFGSTSEFQQLARQLPATAQTIVIRMSRVPYMDKSGFNTMEEILLDLTRAGKEVLIVGIQPQPKYLLEQFDVVPEIIPYNRIFKNFHDCSEWIKDNVKDIYGPESLK